MENNELSNYINIGEMENGEEDNEETLPISYITESMSVGTQGQQGHTNVNVLDPGDGSTLDTDPNTLIDLNYLQPFVDGFADANTLAAAQWLDPSQNGMVTNAWETSGLALSEPGQDPKEPSKSVLINPEAADSQFLIDPALMAEPTPLQQQLSITGISMTGNQQNKQGHSYGTRFANSNRSRNSSPQMPGDENKTDGPQFKRKFGPKDEEKVYCICRKPDDHRVMIQCDICKEWFHIACVNLSKSVAEVIEKYYCPLCDEIPQGGQPKSGWTVWIDAIFDYYEFIKKKFKHVIFTKKNNFYTQNPYENTVADDSRMPLVVVGKKAKSIDPKALIMNEEKEKVEDLLVAMSGYRWFSDFLPKPKKAKKCLFPECFNSARDVDDYCSDGCAVKDADNVLKRLVGSGTEPLPAQIAIPTTPTVVETKKEKIPSTSPVIEEKKTRIVLKAPTPVRPGPRITPIAIKPALVQTTTTTTTPTKGSRSPTLPIKSPYGSSLVNVNDRVRQTSIKQFSDIFTQIFIDLHGKGENNHTDESPERQAEKLAIRIEAAMFEEFATKVKGVPSTCEQPYKSKFRSLHTNLKDKKNDGLRMRVIKGEIPAGKLVKMSSEDLANPELKELAEQVRRESIHKSVLLVAADEPRIKKTHKGDIMIISRSSSPSIENQKDEDMRRGIASGKGRDVPRANISPTSTSFSSVTTSRVGESSDQDDLLARITRRTSTGESNGTSTLISPTGKSNSLVDLLRQSPTDLKTDTTIMDFETFKADNDLEESSAWDPSDNDNMMSDTFAMTNSPISLSPSRMDLSPMELSSHDDGGTPPYLPSPTRMPTPPLTSGKEFICEKKLSIEPVWNGKIIYQGVAKFSAQGIQVAARTLEQRQFWDDILAPQITIEGRIRIEEASKYLSQQGCSNTKDVAVIQLKSTTVMTSEVQDNGTGEEKVATPSENNKEQFDILFDYFHSRKRYGVVGQRYAAVKDMYLVPLAPQDEVPEFVQILEYDEVPEKRDTNILLAVIVIIKGPSAKRKPPPTQNQSHPKKEKLLMENSTTTITSSPTINQVNGSNGGNNSNGSLNDSNISHKIPNAQGISSNNVTTATTNISNGANRATTATGTPTSLLQPFTSTSTNASSELLQSLLTQTSGTTGNSGGVNRPPPSYFPMQPVPSSPRVTPNGPSGLPSSTQNQTPPQQNPPIFNGNPPPQQFGPLPPANNQQSPMNHMGIANYPQNYPNITPPPPGPPVQPPLHSYSPGQGLPPPPFHHPYGQFFPPPAPGPPPNHPNGTSSPGLPPNNNGAPFIPPYQMPPPHTHDVRPPWEQQQQQPLPPTSHWEKPLSADANRLHPPPQPHWEQPPPHWEQPPPQQDNRPLPPPQIPQWNEQDKHHQQWEREPRKIGGSSSPPPSTASSSDHHRSFNPYRRGVSETPRGRSGYRGARRGGGDSPRGGRKPGDRIVAGEWDDAPPLRGSDRWDKRERPLQRSERGEHHGGESRGGNRKIRRWD
ncbi:hypothetical protein G9A89_011107 [Geosiphon pyriformis]|nr:hypothetical protein G9A89_011107 [Geosiphon pyriformis]